MNTLKASTLGMACMLALTACGGGSGGMTVVNPTTNATPATPNNTNTTTTAETNNTTNNETTSTETTNTANTSSTNNTTNNPSTSNNTSTSNNSPKPTTNTNTRPAVGGNFSDAMKKGMVNMKEGTFNGVLINIDKNGNASGRQTANANFEQFRIGSTKVLLLQGVNDKLNSVPVRKMTANDFINGGFEQVKEGWIGSTYGSHGDPEFVGNGLQGFARLRFGVITNKDNTTNLFIHGNPSPRIFAGTYRGSAIMGKDGNYKALPKAVTATVDSALTKVDVSLKTDQTTLKFGGTIDNNAKTFAGTQGGVETRGGFFGYDGLAGVFTVIDGTHKGNHGVYGASNDPSVVSDYGN